MVLLDFVRCWLLAKGERKRFLLRLCGDRGSHLGKRIGEFGASKRIRPGSRAALEERGVALTCVGPVADKDRNEVKPLELLDGAGPGSAFFKVGGNDERGIGQGVDQLVALHCVSNVKA